MKKLIYTSLLWKRFFRYLMIGFSILILMLVAQQDVFVNFQQSSPKLAIAEDTWDGTSEVTYESSQSIADQDSIPTWDGTSEVTYESSTPISQPSAPSSSDRAPGKQAGPPDQGSPPAQGSSCGDFTLRYSECDWGAQKVREVWQDSCGVYQYRNVHTEPGQCNAPSSQPSQPSQPRTVNTCVGQKSWDNLVIELKMAGYNGSWDEGSAVAAYNRAACPVSQPPAPPAPPAPPVPPAPPAPPAPPVPPAPPAPVINNNNTNTNTSTNTNNNTNTVTVQGGVTTREVVREVAVVSSGNVGIGTSASVLGVKELPKTGLPVLAWAALAFIPAGFKIKRFSRIKQELIDNPSYIWEDRQFKR